MFIVAYAGIVLPIKTVPSLYVPCVKLSTEEPLGVIVKPASAKRLEAATSPIVNVVSVIAPAKVAPDAFVLFIFKVVYVMVGIVCAEALLKLTTLVVDVAEKVVMAKVPPKFTIEPGP